MVTFESYNWNLLTVFYLQQVNVLPVLDETMVRPGVTVAELENYFKDIDGREFEADKGLCVAELVAGFYKFYSGYNWDNWISIRVGRSLAPGSEGLLLPDEKPKIPIRIEEPFEGTNTARAVKKFDLIKNVIDEVALIASKRRNLYIFIDEVKQGPKLQPKVTQKRKQKEEPPTLVPGGNPEPNVVRSLDRWVVFNLSDLPVSTIFFSRLFYTLDGQYYKLCTSYYTIKSSSRYNLIANDIPDSNPETRSATEHFNV